MSRWLLALLLHAAAAASAEPPSYHVMMLLYRGCEEACRGFQDHFGRQQVRARFTLRDADQDARRIPGFVAEARRLRPDLVVAWGTTVALETVGQWDAVDRSRHIADIPVVFMAVSDPLQSRLVPTLAGSGRNLAGTLYLLPVAEQLRAARAYLDFRRMGFLYNPAEANSLNSLQDLRAQASHFGFSLVVETLPIGANGQPSAGDIPGRIAALAAAGVDLLYFSPDSFLNSQRRLVTGEALARQMPVFAAAEAPVTQADALLGVLNRYDQIGRFTARLALRILREGAPPGELPIELPRQFSYLINLRVAHRLGRYPPLPLLDIAEIVGGPACTRTKGKACD
jgi:putative ABC transport system substrate-binding protein